MYYYLTAALKRRLILELQDIFSRHPVYKKICPNIQNKYSFASRPHFGIILRGSSGSKLALSGDNFLGTISSHVMLGYVGRPCYPVEWVREDIAAVRENQGEFPLQAGIYYIEIQKAPENANDPGAFTVDPVLRVLNEEPFYLQDGLTREAQLQHLPQKGSLRLWDRNRILLREDKDYSIDYSSGVITFHFEKSSLTSITADYYYAVARLGPFEFHWNTADAETLPGVILAFGKRAAVQDRIAIVVHESRQDVANAYGGKFEFSFDLEVVATDPTQAEEIADLTTMGLLGDKKNALEFEGLEILDVSFGGEAEEIFDESSDKPFYTISMSVQIRSDWEFHVPLPLTISKVTAISPAEEAKAPPGQRGTSQVQAVFEPQFFTSNATLVGRNADFERLG